MPLEPEGFFRGKQLGPKTFDAQQRLISESADSLHPFSVTVEVIKKYTQLPKNLVHLHKDKKEGSPQQLNLILHLVRM